MAEPTSVPKRRAPGKLKRPFPKKSSLRAMQV
jgi:hypothetical protein